MKGRCIAFANHKGGTGKTTLCVNVAGELAEKGKRVLVVDLDPQGNATSALGVEKNHLGACMYDVLWSRCEGYNELSIKDVICSTRVDNLDIAPATLDLSGILTQFNNAEKPFSVLKDSINEVKGVYDFILLDTPPSYGYFLINAVYAADSVLIPLDSGAFTTDSIQNFSTLLEDMGDELGVKVKVQGVTLTIPQDNFNYKSSRLISQLIPSYKHPSVEVEDKIRVLLSVNNLFTDNLYVIPYCRKVYEAQSAGVPLKHHDPKNSVNGVYQQIADGLISEERFI